MSESPVSPLHARASRSTRAQLVIVVAHLALALLYGALNPPWEAHDETGHFAYVSHLVTQHALPDAYSTDKVLFDQAHQPPAYYVAAATLTGWMDRSDGVGPQFNRFALDGTNRRGARIMLRQPGEAFPWTGTIAALHGARVVSALLTTLTIVVIAMSANTLFGRGSSAAQIATALAAFNPQVIFMGSMVNNDAMAALAGALTGYWLLVINKWSVDGGASRDSSSLHMPPSTRHFPTLGLSLSLAFLSKNSAIALIGFVAVALIFIAWRNRWPMRDLVIRGAITFGTFALTVAPYVAYTLSRYGRVLLDRNVNNPLLEAPTSVIGEGIFVSFRDAWLPQLFSNTFNTFWGKFGWGNIGLPGWVYWVLAAVCTAGAIGCVLGWRRANRTMRTGLTLLVMFGLSMMALPLYRAIFFQDPALLPGRYLMPALMAYVGLLGFGWADGSKFKLVISNWMRRQPPPTYAITQLLIPTFAIFAFVTPFAFILPRYTPALTQSTQMPALLRFDDVAEVADVQARTVYLPDREGMRHYARVQLTWRALTTTDDQWAFGITVLGRDNEQLGSMNVYPNKGNYPSTNWHAGDTFVDEYDILLEKPCARLPALGRVSVSVFQFDALEGTGPMTITQSLPALDGEGREISPIIGRFKVDEAPPFAVFWQPPLASFDGIWLRDAVLPKTVKPGESASIQLTYEMLRPNGKDSTAFVHLLGATGQPVTQDDHAPQNGNFPTSMWESGECLREGFVLKIPEGTAGPLRVVTGFYDANFTRFKTGTQDDLVVLGEIQVEP
jgi:4-amino-4-deoxy-L-arabinose transferase-like glycosyltransferase